MVLICFHLSYTSQAIKSTDLEIDSTAFSPFFTKAHGRSMISSLASTNWNRDSHRMRLLPKSTPYSQSQGLSQTIQLIENTLKRKNLPEPRIQTSFSRGPKLSYEKFRSQRLTKYTKLSKGLGHRINPHSI